MAIDSRNGQTTCNTTTDKNLNLVTVTASTDEHEVGSFLDTPSPHSDYTTSDRLTYKLSHIPVLQDGVPSSFWDGGGFLRYFDSGDFPLRRCPNNNEETGETGGKDPQATEDYGRGARPRSNFVFHYRSSGGGCGGQGNGDDDEDRPSDYNRRRLNCDGKPPNKTKDLKPKRDGFRGFHRGRGDSRSRRGHRPPIGTDEIDASMLEQANLLDQVRTAQRCLPDQVVYSTQQGAVVAFIQMLFERWSTGSSINPGFSEGVIFDRNLFISDGGQYRFGEEFVHYAELGRGDFGITRACQDSRTGAKMASKEIPRDRFLPFEVLQLSKLRSPFIAQFLGATAESSSLYLHMELVDDAYQLEHIASDATFLLTDQHLIVKILLQLLGALDCLSRCSIIHRDLTCRNVLLTTAERVKVIDFNLAVPSPYEQNTMPVGDIHYLAPEVLDGVRQLTCAIDLWSAAIIIIALLRGLPQLDDCEKMAITGYHPLNCSHLGHCHPLLADILRQMLHPDWKERQRPGDLVSHPVFQDAVREDLECIPARPDDGGDSPDWSILEIESSDHDDDGSDHDDNDVALPLIGDQNISGVPGGGGHMSLLHGGLRQLEASQYQPLSLPVSGASAGGLSSIDGYHDNSKSKRHPQGARRKERKKVQIAASFMKEIPQFRKEQSATSHQTEMDSVGDVGSLKPRNDAPVVQEVPLTRQHHDMLGAVGGYDHRPRNQRGVENVDSMAEMVRGVEMSEITKTRDWEGRREGQEGRVRNHHELSGMVHHEPSQIGDQVPSQAVTSRDFQNDLCDGPYRYPEDWLYSAETQKTTEEEPKEERRSPLVSNGGSSVRGTSQEETSLETDILIDQLSLDNNPEYQEEIIRQLGSGFASFSE